VSAVSLYSLHKELDVCVAQKRSSIQCYAESSAFKTSADYKKCLSSQLVGEERQRELSACHERGAERLLQLCFANGGVYTKLGQHIGQLVSVGRLRAAAACRASCASGLLGPNYIQWLMEPVMICMHRARTA